METKFFNPKTVKPDTVPEKKIQPNLEVNPPNDKYEQEADQVADRVSRMPISASDNLQMLPKEDEDKKLQMKSEDEESKIQMQPEDDEKGIRMKPEEDDSISMKSEEEEKGKIQMSSNGMGGQNVPQVSSELTSQLNSTRGQGSPLSDDVSKDMGQKMGTDFSNVRVHTDDSAVQMNKELGAKAFTHGNDIYFNRGNFNPQTQSGQFLLAHELTHTIQQKKSANAVVYRSKDLSSPRLKGNKLFEKVFDNKSVIEYGDSGSEVRRIQQCLIDLGYSFPKHGADGIFKSETKAAVKKFQSDHGLADDGRVGYKTIGALDAAFPAFTLPPNRSDPWDINTVLQILCPWNSYLVTNVLSTYDIVTFSKRTRPTETWDGTNWIKGTFNSGGFNNQSSRKMGIDDSLSSERFAFTLYHEGWHAIQPSGLTTSQDVEFDSYVNTEQWSIDIGISGQKFKDKSTGKVEDLRKTKEGNTVVEENAAKKLVKQSYGDSAVKGEEVLNKVGANQVRVQDSTGKIYIRNAKLGDRIMGAPSMTIKKTIDPKVWKCPVKP